MTHHTINNQYKREPLRLASMCLAHDIPFEIAEYWNGLIIGYPSLQTDERVSDAVCHDGSYGRQDGLLELMGLLTEEELEEDGVLGWLTAEQVFERWHKHWLETHAEEEGE
jgi:hypothetical protein